MPVIEYQRAATWRDLRIAARQYRRDQADIVRKRGVDVCMESLGYFYHDYGNATSSAGLRQTKVNRSTIVSYVTKHQCLLRSFVPLRGAYGRLRLPRAMYGNIDDKVRPTQPPLSAGSSRRPL